MAKLHCTESPLKVELRDGRCARAKTVGIAFGAAYRRPQLKGLDEPGIHDVNYWASSIEGRLCQGSGIVLLGREIPLDRESSSRRAMQHTYMC